MWHVLALLSALPPQIGILKDLPPLSLYFYDGAECLRQLDENPLAVARPRGMVV